MGLLQKGKWVDQWYDTKSSNGKFIRKESQFRNWITKDGLSGPTGKGGFKAEPGRYHLYVSYACPWAHRALIFRSLKSLEKMISLSVVNWYMGPNGWSFIGSDSIFTDTINNTKYLYEVYIKADSNYSGRVTVPVLWDKKTSTIVSNESADIIRMFNSAFDEVGAKTGDYYPLVDHKRIDEFNDLIYHTVNNGVYKAGFATSQKAYENALGELFKTLNIIDGHLKNSRYLTGPNITEADWRLFTTLVRFDSVYFGHFKCNLQRIEDYLNISGYLRDLYQQPNIAMTVNMSHIKNHYYGSHKSINPTGIIPKGPYIDFCNPHGRDSF